MSSTRVIQELSIFFADVSNLLYLFTLTGCSYFWKLGHPVVAVSNTKSIMRACRRFEFRFSWGPQTQFLLSYFSISSYLSFRDKT